MNPAALERIAKYSVYPVKATGFLLRKSSFYRRDFYCMTLGRRAESNARVFVERNKRILVTPVRHASTNAFGASSTVGTVSLLLGSSAVIAGGIYYYSHTLMNSVVFRKALNIMNRCPLILDLLGTSVLKVNIARGSVHNGRVKMTFVLKGGNEQYLVTLQGNEEDESIEVLSLHRRAEVPATEYFIYRDGNLVVELSEEKKSEMVLESNVKEVDDELKE